MAGGGAEGATSLEYTPTWVVASVCSVIVAISFALERSLHFFGKYLKRKNQKPLFEALQKVKEELMLLGFISLLLTVSQGTFARICIPESISRHLLPCKREDAGAQKETAHFQNFFVTGIFGGGGGGGRRRLLAVVSTHRCSDGKVPLLSLEALHQLHIFIFVLAIVHVVFSLLTMVLGGAKIREWKHWEDSIANDKYDTDKVLKNKVTHVHDHAFIRENFLGFGKDFAILSWLHSFIKQFYPSVTKSDYITLRLGFVMEHCPGNPKFDFHKYMMQALEADFKKVVGISWYLWVFVVIFLVLNVEGWHTYFWIAILPLILLLAVGTKLEHVITQLAHSVAEKHVAVEGELVFKPSDDHFWFKRPRIVLFLIHFILFQNAFEIAFFFWILMKSIYALWLCILALLDFICLCLQTTYGFDSCIMGQTRYIIPRLVIGVIIQILCSYSTLPLYALVTQMGSSFKKFIFDEHVQQGLVGWAQKVKKRRGLKPSNAGEISAQANARASEGIQLQQVVTIGDSVVEGSKQPTNGSKPAAS